MAGSTGVKGAKVTKVTNQNPGILRFLCHLWLKRSRHKAAPTVLPHPWLKCRMDGLRNWGGEEVSRAHKSGND